LNPLQRLKQQAQGDNLKARLIRGGLGSAGVQAANRLLALGLGIVLARMLGPDGYGIYAYAFAIMSLLMVAAEAGVPTLLMREVAAAQGKEEWGLLRGALRRGGQFVALAATTVSLLGLLVLWGFAESLRPEVLYTTVLMLLVLPITALCKTVAHAMRGLHRVVIGQAVDMLIRPLLVLIIVTVVFLAWPEQRQPHVAMAAQLLGALMVLLLGALVLRRFIPDESRVMAPEYKSRQWLKSALPFTLIGGAMIINTQADILMLGWFVNSEDVGVYRVAAQSSMLVLFFFKAATSVLAPNFSTLYSQGDKERLKRAYSKSRLLIFFVTFPLASVLILGGGGVLSLLFGHEFYGGRMVLAILSLGYLLNVSFGPVGNMMQMLGRESDTAKTLWVVSIANIGINFALIPYLGIEGAAIATSITVVAYHAVLRMILREKEGL